MAIEIPLKEKYRERKPPGNKSRSNNNARKRDGVEGRLTPRRVNYGPFWWLVWGSTLPIDRKDV